MTSGNLRKSTALGAGVITIPLAAIAWLATVPGLMSPVTFTALSLVAFGAAYIGLNTWRNGQATEGIAQVLQRTEAPVPRSDAGLGDPR